MLRHIFARIIDSFERTWSYDASYMRFIANAAPATFLKFSFVTTAADRKAAPADALAAAAIAATIVEGCGPCNQISADIAAASGVGSATLRAILAGDEAAMGETAALAWRFARASLARDLETADPLREEIVRRWGERGLVALAFQINSGRTFPTLKYALGYGKACSKVRVAGEDAPVAHLPLAA